MFDRTIVLNSLDIDPGYIWKGNWRFFDEHTLRTCDKRKPKDKPLDHVIDDGMTFEEFLYLAECNGASIVPYLASNTSLAQFYSVILAACTRRFDDLRLVCSYNRSTLQQTGSGHFSPIAAYHAKDNLVLILDVARFKYPTHWIPVELLWQSMCTIDATTGKSRGFYLISKWPNDISIECATTSCSTVDERIRFIDRILCSPNESLHDFINEHVQWLTLDCHQSSEMLILGILRALTAQVVQVTCKWTYDIMQKYRLKAVSDVQCTDMCQSTSLFEFYATLLPEQIDDSREEKYSECQKPCSRITRSHVHVYALPSRCALIPFMRLFEHAQNRVLYQVIERMQIEQYLTISETKPMYLYGGLSSMVNDIDDDKNIISQVERGLTTIFFYALRTDQFLATIDLFDSSHVTSDLQDEIQYARNCFGLV
jgi:hypothetical protein